MANTDFYINIKNTIEPVIIEAGHKLKKYLNIEKTIDFKAEDNPVSNLDKEIETFIVNKIVDYYPDHKILSEEGSLIENKGSYQWVIDPLDGTVNYIHGFPLFSISAALRFEDEIILGIVYDPVRDEIFSAVKGNGCYVNGKQCYVNTCDDFKKALIGTSFAYISDMSDKNIPFELFKQVSYACQSVRRIGSTALLMAWLASGRIDGYWVLGNKPWDFMGGVILVEEAGGICTDLNGEAIGLETKNIYAGNKYTYKKLTSIKDKVIG